MMTMQRLTWMSMAAAGLAAITGCTQTTRTGDTAATAAGPTAVAATAAATAPAPSDYYAELMHNGRLHVVGGPESHERVKGGRNLTFSRNILGMGRDGGTLVVEIDPKDDSFGDRLVNEYYRRNYYAEHELNGRLHVLGHPDSLARVRDGRSLTFSRNILGKAPGGGTLVVEIDPRDDSFGDRLVAEFDRRHAQK